MVKHTKGFKGLSKKVLSAILAASMIMTSSSFVLAAEPTDENVMVEQQAEVGEATKLNPSNLTYNDEGEELAEVVSGATYKAGEAVEPIEKIKYEGKLLKEGQDYEISYENNVDSFAVTGRNAKVTIVFTNDYQDLGTITQEFEIAQFKIDGKITVKHSNQVAYVYNGKEQYPAIESVTVQLDDETTAELGENDYSIEVSAPEQTKDLINAGTKKCKVVGRGNYTGQGGYLDYEIGQADIAKGATAEVKPTAFGGTANTVANNVVVTDAYTGQKLTADKDYTIYWLNEATGEYVNNRKIASMDVGTHKIRIYGNAAGNFSAESYIDTTYEITEAATLEMAVDGILSKLNVGEFTYDADQETLVATYTGNDLFVNESGIQAALQKAGLKANVFSVDMADAEWINAGEYAITVTGKNIYAGEEVTIPVKILAKAMNKSGTEEVSKIKVEATQGKAVGGADGDILVKITDSSITNPDLSTTLEEGKDYTYTTKTQGGNTYVVINGIGNYTTAISSKVTTLTKVVKKVNKINLADSSISAKLTKSYEYTGKQIKPLIQDVELVGSDGKALSLSDVKIKYGENVNAGTNAGTVTIYADDDSTKYYGERTIAFDIIGESFEEVFKLADVKDFEKGDSWNDILKAIKVQYQSDGATFATGFDTKGRIEVKISKDGKAVDLTEKAVAGVYDVKVTPATPAAGRYMGELTTTINVLGDDLQKAGAKIADIADVVYTGEEQKPAVVVTIGAKTLEEGKDYTVAYSDNVYGGEATVTVTGMGEYSGTITKNFNITKAEQGIYMTVAAQERDLGNGSRYINSKDCTLKLATNVADPNTKLTYSSSDTSVATVSADGVIRYRQVGECVVTVTAAATDNCEAATLDIKVVVGKVGAPTFTPSVVSSTPKKAFRVTTSTVRGADGFEVQYSIKSNFWAPRTKDFKIANKVTRQTCTTAQSNKTYYIRTRAYQVIDGEKVYSAWSPVKTVKTK